MDGDQRGGSGRSSSWPGRTRNCPDTRLPRLLRRSDDGEHHKELRLGRVAAHQNIREGLKTEEPSY